MVLYYQLGLLLIPLGSLQWDQAHAYICHVQIFTYVKMLFTRNILDYPDSLHTGIYDCKSSLHTERYDCSDSRSSQEPFSTSVSIHRAWFWTQSYHWLWPSVLWALSSSYSLVGKLFMFHTFTFPDRQAVYCHMFIECLLCFICCSKH